VASSGANTDPTVAAVDAAFATAMAGLQRYQAQVEHHTNLGVPAPVELLEAVVAYLHGAARVFARSGPVAYALTQEGRLTPSALERLDGISEDIAGARSIYAGMLADNHQALLASAQQAHDTAQQIFRDCLSQLGANQAVFDNVMQQWLGR